MASGWTCYTSRGQAAKTKYDAKCGAPNAGNPKVFFKYFYVNTATGEKSGDVLAQAKLA